YATSTTFGPPWGSPFNLPQRLKPKHRVSPKFRLGAYPSHQRKEIIVMSCNNEITLQLEQIALNKTRPFCYTCYRTVPSGQCATCGSDDLMRELPGVGVEWGLDWVIRDLLREHLTPADTAEA